LCLENQLAKHAAHLVRHLLGEIRSFVVHGEEDSIDGQTGVEETTDIIDR
jgi:hypothetical protein